MKLGEIRNYIKRHGGSTLADVAIHFDISKEAAKLALDYWVNKGKIEEQSAACGSSCGGCSSSNESYKWVTNEKLIQWL